MKKQLLTEYNRIAQETWEKLKKEFSYNEAVCKSVLVAGNTRQICRAVNQAFLSSDTLFTKGLLVSSFKEVKATTLDIGDVYRVFINTEYLSVISQDLFPKDCSIALRHEMGHILVQSEYVYSEEPIILPTPPPIPDKFKHYPFIEEL